MGVKVWCRNCDAETEHLMDDKGRMTCGECYGIPQSQSKLVTAPAPAKPAKRRATGSETTKKELDTAYGQVSRILEKYPAARDSDRVVYFQVLRETLTAGHLGPISRSMFLAILSGVIQDAYAPSTIKRVRAAIQNKEERLEASEEVKERRRGRQTDFKRWATERKERGV
jgi:hypothetical protein